MAKKKPKGGSLQDQLRAAGLVSEKQLKKAKKNLHRQEVRIKHGEVDETKEAAKAAQAEKAARDRALNQARQAEMDQKALAAQVRQLIDMNKQREDGEVAYKFSRENLIKTIHISEHNKTQLNKGNLAIVAYGEAYELVPAQVAAKIQTRDPASVIYLYEPEEIDEDDPYKDFQIPDDLEW